MITDYIKEELLRQRAAWAALLTGAERQETAGGAAQRRGGTPDRAYAAAREESTEDGRLLLLLSGERARERSVFYKSAAEAAAHGRAQTGADRTAGDWDGTPVKEEEMREKEARMQITVLRPGAGQVQTAKQLSRIYQRDARRYDGGFALY